MDRFNRTIKLIGEPNFKLIESKTVAVVGLGGVGGYAIEMLVRSGISRIIIVDYDIIDITNLNRQIISLDNNIGKKKTELASKRIKLINPNCEVIVIDEFLNKDNIDILFKYNFDYLIDACDTIITKKLLIKGCIDRKIKIISCMGTGNKLNPELLKITDIKNTNYDPIAKIIRKYVKDEKINNKLMVVSSSEQPKNVSGTISSISFVPANAGILCASYVINDIIKTL